MKSLLLIFIVSILMSSRIFSQTFQWRLQPDSPGATGSGRFEDIFFIDANTGWIAGFDGTVFKTTNSGTNWSQVSEFEIAFRSIGFFDSNTGMLGTLINDSTKILYRTTNGGHNWTPVTNFTGRRPRGICGISIVNENLAYACGRYFESGRVIKTTDKGISWTTVLSDTSLARTLIDCYFWSPDSGIAVGGSLPNFMGSAIVLRTTNGGVNWVRVHKTTRSGEWCWKISFVSRDVGYVSVERETGFAYILKTTNSGANWTDIPFREYDEEGIGFINENTGWVGGWTGPTYETTNGGANWHLAGWGTNLNRFRFLNDTLAFAVGDRVYRYERGPVGIQPVSTEVPSSIYLHQNYPNPFNPLTHLGFGISNFPKGQVGFVSLKIYDGLGREVQTLVDEKLSPGSYKVVFDGSSLSSGIYFYKLSVSSDKFGASNFSEVRKMILLK